jgi:hypothetical protein
MKYLPFLILFGINCFIYTLILVITLLILFRIKIKLNLGTQLSFLSILVAMFLRILLSIYWYVQKNRNQTIFINFYIYVCDSLIVTFYILNFGRVLASWMLTAQIKHK